MRFPLLVTRLFSTIRPSVNRSSQSAKARNAANRPIAVGCAVLLAIAAMLAARVGAQTKPADLPPPPGALERELGASPPALADEAGSATVISQPIEIPFIFEGGHIIIEASIGGGPPKPFLFDTGSGHLISPEMAQTFHAPVVRTGRAGGFGSKISQMDVIDVDRITISGATLEHQKVGVLDLPNVILDRGSRPRLAGIIGSELLLYYAVTIDYSRRTMTLNSPGFRPPSAKFSLPLGMSVSIDGLGHPQISAEFDGIAGDFVLDTGASGQVSLSEKFQREHQPFANIAAILHFLSVGGIGGHAKIAMAFGKQFRIGPSSFPSPLASGVDPGNSGIARSALSNSAGVIGNGTLANFIVTIDVGATRAYFEPVERPHATTLFGTGMILDKPDHETFQVLDILKGSAAERAGLQPGDRVIAVAGLPARDLALSDAHAFAPNGQTALTILTADHRQLNLAYGRLLP